jgi:hypothetical protein
VADLNLRSAGGSQHDSGWPHDRRRLRAQEADQHGAAGRGMRRDMELVRKLLIYFDDKPDEQHVKVADIKIDGYDDTLVLDYHMILLYEAGLIAGEPQKSGTGRIVSVLPFRLTWNGHEFIAAARNDSIWRKAKTKVATTAVDVPFAILKEVLMQILRGDLSSVGGV